MAAGLLLVLTLNFDLFPNGFPISDLRHGKYHVYPKISFQLGNHRTQVLLAQSGEDHLIGCRILLIGQGLVFLQNLLNRRSHLCLIAPCRRTHCHTVARCREAAAGQADYAGTVTQCITGIGGKLCRCHQIPCFCNSRFRLLLAAKEEQFVQFFCGSGFAVHQFGTSFQCAGNHPHHRQFSHIGVCQCLVYLHADRFFR